MNLNKKQLTMSLRISQELAGALEQYRSLVSSDLQAEISTSVACRRLIEYQLVQDGLLSAVTPWPTSDANAIRIADLKAENARLKELLDARNERSRFGTRAASVASSAKADVPYFE